MSQADQLDGIRAYRAQTTFAQVPVAAIALMQSDMRALGVPQEGVSVYPNSPASIIGGRTHVSQ